MRSGATLLTTDLLIRELGLRLHPEGGYYRETTAPRPVRPASAGHDRST